MRLIPSRKRRRFWWGKTPSEALFAAVGQAAAEGVEPEDDVHASAAFRRHLSAVLTRRALRTAAERATDA